MDTKYYDFKNKIEDEKITEIIKAFKDGEIIAFPTETVYGLGADINNDKAIRNIFKAKNRPVDNPLIAHIGNIDNLEKLVDSVPKKAKMLMDKFWPGPLTIVLKKKDSISSVATGGLNTIGIRMPNHIITEIILSKDLTIVAPSANISGSPSPTSFSHVKNDLDRLIYGIINGGECLEGIESTILEITDDKPVVLRPGTITIEELREVIGEVDLDSSLLGKSVDKPKAPGMKYRHYAPKGEVYIIQERENIEALNKKIAEEGMDKKNTAIVSFEENLNHYSTIRGVKNISLGSRNDLKEGISYLYSILRDCDSLNIENIFIEKTEENNLGFAYMNRVKKAANNNFLRGVR